MDLGTNPIHQRTNKFGRRTSETHAAEKEKIEKKEMICTGYKIVSGFDVGQTEGRELPSIGVNELTGDVEAYQHFSQH